MIEERMLRNQRIKKAKEHLSKGGYLKTIEEFQNGEKYQEIITHGVESWKKLMEDVNPMFAQLATYENLDTEVFDELCLSFNEFFTQTESYDPPEDELRRVMKIAFCSLDLKAGKAMKKYIEEFVNTLRICEQILLSEI